MKPRVQAIISDYDGTLLPTAHVKNPKTNTIPRELEEILEEVCSEIPICVVSTKDFEFLRNKTTFARMLSCIMGIETLILKNHGPSQTIEKRLLHTDLQVLELNPGALEVISEEVSSWQELSHLLVEHKYTSDGILAGLTIDWRQLGDDWSYHRSAVNHFISRMVANLKKPPAPAHIYVQKYSMPPFVDIYSTECNKGLAFDTVISELAYASVDGKGTFYLGDSENDNPAFRKAGISIGIRSDARLNPKLNCSYFLDYKYLSSFLVNLRNEDYLFSEELLEAKA